LSSVLPPPRRAPAKVLSTLLLSLVAGPLAAAPAAGPCDADLDQNGTVDFADLVGLLAQWGPCPGCSADLDGSGEVDFGDLLELLSLYGGSCGFEETPLIGTPLASFPHFEYFQTTTTSVPASVTVDPAFHPEAMDVPTFVYIVADRDQATWDSTPALTDVRGAPQAVIFSGADRGAAAEGVAGFLSGTGGQTLGVPYDVVVDLDLDGQLSTGDLIDGYSSGAGFHVVDDTTLIGPLATSSVTYSGGTFLGQVTVYPTSISSMGQLPLVVISHGNGHQYTWYTYLQNHLASRGYIVMSHQNNTSPGIESASTTTLTNTQYIIANQGSIGGGVLNGHIDTHRIIWIGHSRGGEGVVRAYDRIFDGTYTPTNFTLSDIVLISSIAPTDFLGVGSANPHGVDYHLIYGAADGDVSGRPDCDLCQSFHLLERATGRRFSTYLHAADHNDFNCCGFEDYCGSSAPCSGAPAIGRPEVQDVTKATYFALLDYVIGGNSGAKDFLWRQYESLRPIGVGANVVVDHELKEAAETGKLVIDDFQTQTATNVSSIGGAVTGTVTNLVEGIMNDNNSTFAWVVTDPMNGMTRALGLDSTRGAVFDWNAAATLEFEIPAGSRDVSDYEFISMRACQGSRHPNTAAESGDATFTIRLVDGNGDSQAIRVGLSGGGAEEPFARTGYGAGTGWQNEFETIRIRLSDFLAGGAVLNLSDVAAIRLEFGAGSGSSTGRLGLDDLEFVHP